MKKSREKIMKMAEDKIKIVDFDIKYIHIYEKYEKILKSILPSAEISLFGSAAVPMKGKEEIDILVVVNDLLDSLESLKKEGFTSIQQHGDMVYIYDYRFGIEGEFHLVTKGHEKIKRVLSFLELLKKDTKLREELQDLKESCNGLTKEEYRLRKTEFLKAHKLI